MKLGTEQLGIAIVRIKNVRKNIFGVLIIGVKILGELWRTHTKLLLINIVFVG
jgi:hypothetical protein